jgi:hypothetical protein
VQQVGYWENKCHLEQIKLDLKKKKCVCGCFDKLKNYDVMRCRMIHAGQSSEERSSFILGAASITDVNGRTQYMSSGDAPIRICNTAWCVERGFHQPYVSKVLKSGLLSSAQGDVAEVGGVCCSQYQQ